jgi:hypothetical protein
MGFILVLPGLLRTVSAGLLVASQVATELAPLATAPLEKAAIISASLGLFRALVRKFK